MQVQKLKATSVLFTVLAWGTFLLSGCGQYVMANKLNEFEKVFEQRLQISKELSPGKVQMTYQDQIQVNGGIPPYKWEMLDGQLPPGLTLDSSTGQVVGMPRAAETRTFVVLVSDASNKTNGTLIQSFVLKVE